MYSIHIPNCKTINGVTLPTVPDLFSIGKFRPLDPGAIGSCAKVSLRQNVSRQVARPNCPRPDKMILPSDILSDISQNINQQKKSRATKAIIITGTPYKEELETSQSSKSTRVAKVKTQIKFNTAKKRSAKRDLCDQNMPSTSGLRLYVPSIKPYTKYMQTLMTSHSNNIEFEAMLIFLE
ncbi:hypothetical protein Zmor_028355 [Zophobas morio]|uniref:Uncharacterized protein n=1 Tax=Zophobas morio TaxID=2755281 RepID=A0AA38M303_9CUCU|nr:hypothetical protein Zmor_028355 [Zophobas morio]